MLKESSIGIDNATEQVRSTIDSPESSGICEEENEICKYVCLKNFLLDMNKKNMDEVVLYHTGKHPSKI